MLLSSSELVLFLDSDVALDNNWIELAVKFIDEHPEVASVGGAVIYGFDHELVNAFGGEIGLSGLAWDSCESTSLTEIVKPEQRINEAWNTADGAMEGSIGIEAEMMGLARLLPAIPMKATL